MRNRASVTMPTIAVMTTVTMRALNPKTCLVDQLISNYPSQSASQGGERERERDRQAQSVRVNCRSLHQLFDYQLTHSLSHSLTHSLTDYISLSQRITEVKYTKSGAADTECELSCSGRESHELGW